MGIEPPVRSRWQTSKSVHARQHPVQDDEIGRMVTRQDQSCAAIGCRINGVAFVGQSPLKQFEDSLVVFDDKYAFVHGSRSKSK